MKKVRRLILIGSAVTLPLLLLLYLFVPSVNLMVSNAVRKYITGNDYPLDYFAASPAGDSVSLRWGFPNDIRFHHVEVYYSPDGPADRSGQKIAVPNQRTRFMHFTPPKKEGMHFFAAYTVDLNGAYSEPVHDCFNWTPSAPFDGYMSAYYQPTGNWVEGKEFQWPFIRLENEYLRCYFVNGGMLGVENKHSVPNVMYNRYGLYGSYLNGMDMTERDPATGKSIDMLGNWVDESMTDSAWIAYKVDSNSVEATRYTVSGGAHGSMRYTLDSNTVHFELIPRNDKHFAFRFNTTGNGEYKAVTHWSAVNIRAKIEDGEDVEAQYSGNTHISYVHRDEVFNDDFPYLKSRVFLALYPESELYLMHQSDTLFRLHNFKGSDDFYYKNCWGEESFGFGTHWPYDKYLHTIDQPFSMDIEVLH